jgi:hypothetical protein
MEIEKKNNDSEKNNKQLLEYINSFNFTQSELEIMTLEDFINHVYQRNVW